ncbi:MAG TPA: UDP-N-acetylmuramoyl-L-alanine--D-glutamate ligase [Thioalkalivibrio sp.]|nr:UDP-N-acetylmuramoyl-L-alanine--D-glutamate ligase [Thioalkalivibrio sp.]
MSLPAAQVEQETLVVGLGATGLSVIRHLLACGQRVAVTDTRENPPGLDALNRIEGAASAWAGPLSALDAARWRHIVVSPGVPVSLPGLQAARAAGCELIGDVQLFVRAARQPLVAITGSNGKSTVTALAGELLRALGLRTAVGGNLGPPALELLRDDPEVYVLELSSFQLETTSDLGAASAAILNISADHLDRYPDMDAYLTAKTRILQGARQVVLNRDDDRLRPLCPSSTGPSFGLSAPPGPDDFGAVEVAGEPWLARGEDLLLPAADLALHGRHNWLNALAALALVWPWVEDPRPLLPVLRTFAGLAHRSQRVRSYDGIEFIDDSKGTNVGAALAAIRGVTGPLVLIAGGQGKGQDFAPLADALVGKARCVILLGVDAPQIAQALNGAVPLRLVTSMEEAVSVAAQWAQPGDTVLLSPACASLDMFSSFAERGERFARAVRELDT